MKASSQAVTLACVALVLAVCHGAVATNPEGARKMVRLHARMEAKAAPAPAANAAPAPGAKDAPAPRAKAAPASGAKAATAQVVKDAPAPAAQPDQADKPASLAEEKKVDPGMKLSMDSDATLSLQHAEAMRLTMRNKAELVIASHSGGALSSSDVDEILSGNAASLHPGVLSNISWTMDIFESGTALPTTSTKVSVSVSSSSKVNDVHTAEVSGEHNAFSDARDLNHDGIISVDEMLGSFFHADDVNHLFDQVQAASSQQLGKVTKKEIIKQKAPVLHKTIEKVASHRGWGIQDARFAQLHLDTPTSPTAHKAFADYNTFVKTMRSALITPGDAAKDTAVDQLKQPQAARADPATKA
ncbi:hypothetical protein L1887_59338 [Cichorium endivia]|uniref:EF-hand domain-containing protein n=1 Tax=Pseudozyma antarctica (strain T-34) TaxID=1151754 RepID=M9LZY4_PSEA3|nr:hypothetical protein L1887_59338 [Cichorium endivia]GAC76694.1 hypothetical protein PANT_22d00145 [Moesziomyces antarcticus T-34]